MQASQTPLQKRYTFTPSAVVQISGEVCRNVNFYMFIAQWPKWPMQRYNAINSQQNLYQTTYSKQPYLGNPLNLVLKWENRFNSII